jgi:hypothetical protein
MRNQNPRDLCITGMDSLEDFEKSLEVEKAARQREDERKAEKEERRRHHKRSHHGHSEDRDDDRHRHRRRRRDEDGDRRKQASEEEPKYLKPHDPKADFPIPDQEKPLAEQTVTRDEWMTAPDAVEYRRRTKQEKSPSPPKEAKRFISKRELNSEVLRGLNEGVNVDALSASTQRKVEYTFGDEGSQWRMTKLEGVYRTAENTGQTVEDVARRKYGSLEDFDDAREEKMELERRSVYGKGYVGKERPSGDLYRERTKDNAEQFDNKSPDGPEQGIVVPEEPRVTAMDQTALNRLRAQMMKAKLRKAPDAAKLEAEYNAAMSTLTSGINSSNAVVLGAEHSRMLAGPWGEVKNVETRRGRERGQVEANDDISIEDMVREERRTRGATGGEGMRLAERIAKDAKFDDDLEYLDENAEKLAKRVHKSEASLKNMAVSEFTKMNKVLENCPLCHHEDREPPQDRPLAPIISLATRVFMTLPTEPELTGAEGGAVITPISHRRNLLECDDDEWEEMRNFMKSLTRLYHDQGREVVFYENAAVPQRHMHAALVAIPIPYDLGDTAPAFFREAMLSADEEWSQHKKIIDTGKRARDGLGKLAFRRSIAKEMPYFHVWFNLDGGLGHVVEDQGRWPRGDLFAREIIGGMLDTEPDVIKRQGRWSRNDSRTEGFKKRWRKFDWTRVLTESSGP